MKIMTIYAHPDAAIAAAGLQEIIDNK